MKVRLIFQPFADSEQVGAVLQAALKDALEFTAITAWGKRSGLGRLRQALQNFQGTKRIAIGIDEGGATWEGLRLAMELFNEKFIIHDPGPRTFHSKLYLVRGEERSLLVIGSPNLTKGGLFVNFETAAVLELASNVPEEQALVDAAVDYWSRLTTSLGAAAQPLTEDLLSALASDSNVQIASEALGASQRSRSSRQSQSLFGRTISGLRGAPVLAGVRTENDADSVVPLARFAPRPTSTEMSTGFYKMLSNYDTNARSSPGQIVIPLKFRQFFPPTEVVQDDRSSGGSMTEEAYFPVEFIDGSSATHVERARIIVYTPKADAPRQNTELRFTLRSRSLSGRLASGDVLTFTRVGERIRVERSVPPSVLKPKFAWLTSEVGGSLQIRR